jgi:16S rRNA (uracil1498-N3)-methyltransferase
MGVKKLFPIFTEHTQVKKINIDRINSNLIEAAEQCNFNNIPEVSSAVNFNHILDNWEKFFEDRKVIFCDERSKSEALEVLKDKKNKYNNKWAIIVGPEGGFSDFERNSIDNKNNSLSISLGPRVMRSDTAVVAILAIFQMIIGDWKE